MAHDGVSLPCNKHVCAAGLGHKKKKYSYDMILLLLLLAVLRNQINVVRFCFTAAVVLFLVHRFIPEVVLLLPLRSTISGIQFIYQK